ncbi:MAG: excinuclease ABC subunit UvrC [Propionibacteriaceae bacterium]|jgi:excinuclease ABC subunit C|nr:excinuclease ABC subunit UvrC [Propionibacteriaceae bacterium]
MADPASYRPAAGELPTGPGVYRFLDPQGRIIYVGKAISLRSRVNSYFADPATLHWRTQMMVRTAAQVEWTQVANELEALQLEYTWIKRYEPRFNVKYRDDKSYPWLAVTWTEEFPRAFVGRGAKRSGWRYFGPFGQAWAIRDSLDTLLGVFPVRSCSDGVFRSARSSGRPCLMGHIGKCSAPCVGRIEADRHRRLVDELCAVMGGRFKPALSRFEAEMAEAAQAQEYERAAILRDQLAALAKVAERNAVVLPDGTDADVVALADDPLEVAVQLFQIRAGRLVAERSWVADRADDAELADLIEAFCLQLYGGLPAAPSDPGERRRVVPPQILLPQLPPSPGVLAELLAAQRGGPVRLHTPQRGQKRALLETAARNAAQALALHKTRRASDLATRNRALTELQDALGLPAAPLRIEGYDISHLQGAQTVASMVVFEDGLARPSQYRHFVIGSVESNDVGAIREVLLRRLGRLRDEDRLAPAEDGSRASLIDADSRTARRFAYAPALIVVDGGAPQVAAAQAVLDQLEIDSVALIGLAKRLEEVWRPGQDHPLILPRQSEAMYLLQRVRDESHRFAIAHHRRRRGRSMLESLLDGVPGLGEVRRQALRRHFGSLKRLRAASPDQIAALPGFGPKLAQAVVQAVAQEPAGVVLNTATGEIVSD